MRRSRRSPVRSRASFDNVRVRTAAALALAAASVLSFAPRTAEAAGLYYSERGVRPLARGGAFVAGADDLGAIYYNPAGIMDAGAQGFGDASYVDITNHYQRVARGSQLDPNTGAPTGNGYDYTYPAVKGTTPFLPIPTWGFSWNLGLSKDVNFAIGGFSPYASLTTYPENGPQRYSLISLDGSILTTLGAWAAFRPVHEISIGLGVEALVGNFNSTVAMSSCVPERFSCAPEESRWDVASQLKVGPIISPSGNAGVIWAPDRDIRFGASFQLPFSINAPAKVAVRLPSTEIFEQASQEGEDAHVKFKLPWIARAGIEYRGIPNTRVEVAGTYEAWSMHDKIDVLPDDIVLKNVALFPAAYKIAPISIVRGFRDAMSVHLGMEHKFVDGSRRVDLRLGASYETSAIPLQNLTPLTIDLDKVTVAGGLAFFVPSENWRVDLTYAHIFGIPANVSTSQAAVPQLNPVQANPGAPNYVNAGHYRVDANIFGAGVAFKFY